LFRLRTLVSVRRGELHAGGRLFSVDSVDFVESDKGFPMLGASLTLQAYIYGTDGSGTTVPEPTDPSAVPPAEDGAAVPPATEGTATASGVTG
ncbi:MAG TPA: hypothetical protein VM049_09430, partial [Gaiellaceae bacterium]|nr:hypothetical protein [Gaiellaceae bacterium]